VQRTTTSSTVLSTIFCVFWSTRLDLTSQKIRIERVPSKYNMPHCWSG